VAEGARLESVYTFTGIGGSNPSLSASTYVRAKPLFKQGSGVPRICAVASLGQALMISLSPTLILNKLMDASSRTSTTLFPLPGQVFSRIAAVVGGPEA
jgi:hypothetical protein